MERRADIGRMTTTLLPGSQEDREIYMREHNAASFVNAVDDARRKSTHTIVMTAKAFAGEPEALYVALDYAYHSGVGVTMAPGTATPVDGAD
jgi:hypothetical protein